MGRTLLCVACILAMGLVVAGCGGGSDYNKDKPVAKPTDIGNPDNLASGATLHNNVYWVVKDSGSGENRIYVLYNQVPKRDGGPLNYYPAKKTFSDDSREHVYDINGLAQHKMKFGPNAGQPGVSLPLRRVGKDETSGNILIYQAVVAEADRDNAEKGAYVVVP